MKREKYTKIPKPHVQILSGSNSNATNHAKALLSNIR